MSTDPAWQAALTTLRPLAEEFRTAAKTCTDLYLWARRDDNLLVAQQYAFALTKCVEPAPRFEMVQIYRLPRRDGENHQRIALLCGKAAEVALFRKLAGRAGACLPVPGLTPDNHDTAWIGFLFTTLSRYPGHLVESASGSHYHDELTEDPFVASAAAIDFAVWEAEQASVQAESTNEEPRLLFDDGSQTVFYDGDPYKVENKWAYLIFKAIAHAPLYGHITGDEIQKLPGLRGKRPDKFFKHLPNQLRALIASSDAPGGGYCIRFLAPK